MVPKVPKGVHFCCGDPAEGLQVGRSLSLACTQKDLPMNRPTDEAWLYGFHRREAAINSSPARAIPQPSVPQRLVKPENPRGTAPSIFRTLRAQRARGREAAINSSPARAIPQPSVPQRLVKPENPRGTAPSIFRTLRAQRARGREAAINSSPARAIPPPLNPPAESGQNLLNLLNPGREAAH